MTENSIKLEGVYLGTWIQRTSIHLEEIYRFLKNREGIKGLDPKKLDELWERLKTQEVIFHEETEFDFLEAKCGRATVSITEDGIILLSFPPGEIRQTMTELERFYSGQFGPVLMYLFSRGAPLPKELKEVREAYPILLAVRSSSDAEAKELLKELDDQLISSVHSEDVDIFSGQKVNLFNMRGETIDKDVLEEFLRNIVFFREFKNQLSHYLNLHRSMWDQISNIRESKTIRYRDFPAVRQQILEFLKTLSFVKARIAQMGDIITARSSSINASLKDKLSDLGLNRFEHLGADRKYISHLWEMTISYVNGTLNLLESLFQENTQRELAAVKFITFIAAITGFFGMNIAFPWEERWRNIFPSSLAVVALIIITCAVFYYLIKIFVYNRSFKIRK